MFRQMNYLHFFFARSGLLGECVTAHFQKSVFQVDSRVYEAEGGVIKRIFYEVKIWYNVCRNFLDCSLQVDSKL